MQEHETKAVEIADICKVLERLAHADVLAPSASAACIRGSYLLMAFRVTVLTGGSDHEIVGKLREILAKNQEG